MVKEGRPRRGSLQYVPRKRAAKMLPRVRSWPSAPNGLLGFVGYKVGMATAIAVVKDKQHPFYGQEISVAATAIEVPPMILKSLRLYTSTPYGEKTLTEGSDVGKLSELRDKVSRVSFLLETNPKAAGLPMKRSQVVEIGFSGSFDDALKLLEEKKDQEIRVSEIFEKGSLIDVTAVTKGKGLQGVVKRYGVKLLSHKAEKSRRKVGTLGPWTPKRTPWQAPMAGQTGFHVRTEYNKEILYLGDGKILNPSGGWLHYGLINSDVILLKGSVPGPAKRPLRLRHAIRPPKHHVPLELKEVILYGREVKRIEG